MDDPKQFNLQWDHHAVNLASEAECFFHDEAFLDCTLAAEGQCIQAHKLILSAASPYLATLLRVASDKHPILIFNDLKYDVLKALVSFIYNGRISMAEYELHNFLNAAQSLLVRGLTEARQRMVEAPKSIRKGSKRGAAPVAPAPAPPPLTAQPPVTEDSLVKLQEISFVKYHPQQGRQSAPVAAGPSDDFVVRSWKMRGPEEKNGQWRANGRDPQSSFLFKKFRLEKPAPQADDVQDTSAGEMPVKQELEEESEMELVEPKVEVTEEEDDTNCSEFSSSHEVPVPLLVCKTSLQEDGDNWSSAGENDPSWRSSADNSISSMESSQELPCHTCHKKYKSRYALNRHILYECGKARKSFSCDECGKKVTRQDTLQKHKLIHLVQHMKDKEDVPDQA